MLCAKRTMRSTLRENFHHTLLTVHHGVREMFEIYLLSSSPPSLYTTFFLLSSKTPVKFSTCSALLVLKSYFAELHSRPGLLISKYEISSETIVT